STAAHTGKYSLEFNMPLGRSVHDGFVGTQRAYFDGRDYEPLPKVMNLTSTGQDPAHLTDIQPGDSIRISVWVKASGLYPDSAAKYPTTWAVGITPQFFTKMGNNAGWGGTGSDYQFTFPNVTSFDWTQYHIDTKVPSDTATKGLGVRLHVYSTFVGKVYFDDLTVTKISVATAVELNKLLPSSFKVYQNYPNPFNPSTTISYALPKASPVKVVIYNITGAKVKTLVNKEQTAGMHLITWNGENNNGVMVSSGTYFYRISAGLNVQVRKMIFLK
ncbi:MAG TPA: T9SS type A sorting domain-containing protein, partial [Ignavibacteria bacterium]|nr:T9SS type A sorting domain-containing protein [Ignavibacteria bacterium]